MKYSSSRLRAILMASAALALALPVPTFAAASAQDGGEPPRTSGKSTAVLDFSSLIDTENISATGSRIEARSLISPAPISVMERNDLDFSGEKDLVDFLKRSPALVNSIDAATPLDFFTAFRNFEGGDTPLGPNGRTSFGIGALNLRSLGTGRTLVLVDGRRHVGARAGDTAVDVNSIAPSMIDRVEILTGGASAIYGADAVSGVVNIITRRDREGFFARSDFQINDRGNGERFSAALGYGRAFDGDRGHFQVNIDYRDQAQLVCGEAAFCRDGAIEEQTNNPDPAGPPRFFATSVGFPPGRTGRIALDFNGDFGADTTVPAGVNFFIDVNNDGILDLGQGQRPFFPGALQTGADGNTLRIFDDGTVVGGFSNLNSPDSEISGQDNVEGILPESETLIVDFNTRYRFDKRLEWFADFKGAFTSAERRKSFASFNVFLPVSPENPFVPAPLADALSMAGDTLPDSTQLLVSKSFFDLGIQDQFAERDTLRLVTGFQGDFQSGLSYEFSYNYGRFTEDFTESDERVNDRFFAALDAVIDPATGQPACRSEVDLNGDGAPDLTPPAGGVGFLTFTPGQGICQPLNIFGEGNASQAAIDFVTVDAVNTTRTEQEVISLVLSGDSGIVDVELPAGPIGFAFGGEYRDEFSSFSPDLFSRTGLRFDDAATGNPQNSPLEGSFDVWEVFGEVQLPLFVDAPFAKEMTLSGAFRLSDYSTVGSTFTWQSNLTWAPIDDIAFRGAYSRSIRAPNIRELFLPSTASSFVVSDPCDAGNIDDGSQYRRDNCLSDGALGVFGGFVDSRAGISIPGISAGNPDLEEETADAITIGAVFMPRALPGFTATVDYWSIDLEDAISVVSPQGVVNGCFDANDFPDNVLCDNIARNRGGGQFPFSLDSIRVGTANIGGIKTEGVDFDIQYEFDLGGETADYGVVMLRSFGTWLDRFTVTPNQQTPDVKDQEVMEFRRPEWVINNRLTWGYDALTVSYNLRYMSRMTKGVEIENVGNFLNPFTGDSFIHDIAASYDLDNGLSLYAGINNIGNRTPAPQVTTFPANPLGRRIFLGARYQF
ncbi:TonB-dependent receptor domain-containing protein [Yunchengibacter salinarum]|uniref:TonB-dependent receptor domain-containing protein n=1 Tax=Yunchengibacter salinarum TaxID=3133399 RepID=UPI0035B62D95